MSQKKKPSVKVEAAPAAPSGDSKRSQSKQSKQSKSESKSESKEELLFGRLPFSKTLVSGLQSLLRVYIIYYACVTAYNIRTFAIRDYGLIIHEFDPWFNYRATEYLQENGWTKFFAWFDYMSWYPLGRPVGTTIYPGMQITSVLIYNAMQAFGYNMSLNDVCVYVPVWFGVVATLLLGFIAYECSGSLNAGVAGALVMSMIPAHTMRSVGGGYDNESVAMTAMCLTYYLWVRSLRSSASWPIGIAAGLAYIFMAASWGGYVFVLNMVGIHAGVLAFFDLVYGKFSHSLHRSYSLFFVIGTIGAMRVPIIGTTPLTSLEQMGPLVVFLGMQVLFYCDYLEKKYGYTEASKHAYMLRVKVIGSALLSVLAVVIVLLPTGYFGPLSARVRGLFVKHTRTGNPLVDSVAEHQPASEEAYWQFLHMGYFLAPIGLALLIFARRRIVQSSFLLVYGAASYYFSAKMVRLILLSAPAASALSGIAIGFAIDVLANDLFWAESAEKTAEKKTPEKKSGKKSSTRSSIFSLFEQIDKFSSGTEGKLVKIALAVIFLTAIFGTQTFGEFVSHSEQMAERMANPSIMFKARLQNGDTVMVRDYYDAYIWLRENTPRSARVMAWWDYGYQITGIGNRTSIADGNTWNHEHIALLGLMLTSPVDKAHELIRHLADYVLVWAGGGGDDLAKSPHLARIGNSVYHGLCPGDPTCANFGFIGPSQPTPMMEKSLLYNLVSNGQSPSSYVDPSLFREVHISKYGKVRIYKVMNVSMESKKWVADPANRHCDAPGSWYCPGQYPPAEPLQKVLARKKAFKQH
jgi:dolichyl-diphosphooligosaccharide--protein glycosyltransferase